jgi:hypothetical protein
MESIYLDKKGYHINDEVMWDCIKDSILQALRMLSVQSTEAHARILFEALLPLIRAGFNDFTMNNLASALIAGSRGIYGEYTKMNPITIQGWFNKKRLEISAANEKAEKTGKRVQENAIIPNCNAGNATILGFFYAERKFKKADGNEMTWKERCDLIESGKPCPFTGGNVLNIIEKYDFTKAINKL